MKWACSAILILAVVIAQEVGVHAAPVTAQQAGVVGKAWWGRTVAAAPRMTARAQTVQPATVTLTNAQGGLLCHIVPTTGGFVVVSGDDRLKPIIAFGNGAQPGTTNPLTDILAHDMAHRIENLSTPKAGLIVQSNSEIQNAWANLTASGGLAQVLDTRITPFVQSRWNQGRNNAGVACYNYYTPGGAAGSANNDVCGCVATAMAQVMRYYQWPQIGVGTASYSVSVNGATQSRALRGGNGAGGPYDWSNMALDGGDATPAIVQAIGALTSDAGVAVHMMYTANSSGASSAYIAPGFVNIFKYKNAAHTYIGSDINSLIAAINPNLDAGFPILLSIEGSGGGHEVVCDGYGYVSGAMYHHINLGWAGMADAWYALPSINSGYGYNFTIVDDCTYNIGTDWTGEIVSGRITDQGGTPASGVAVALQSAGQTQATTTADANGIYAFNGLNSSTTYQIAVTEMGYQGPTNVITTGLSGSGSVGNKWGVDFSVTTNANAKVKPTIATQPRGATITIGQSWSVQVVAKGPNLSYQWKLNGTPISGATSSSYAIGSVKISDQGDYTVVVSNDNGAVTSSVATLVATPIPTPPVVTVQPVGCFCEKAGTLSLSVTASGSNLSYQWKKNNVNLTGATQSTYTKSNAQSADSGVYSVLVSNPQGSALSDSVAVTVGDRVVIKTQPSAKPTAVGDKVALSVLATGTGPGYQWKKDGVNILGATQANYTISSCKLTDAGSFSVRVFTTYTNLESASTPLIVQNKPAITNQPAATNIVAAGDSVTLSVQATGENLYYQWKGLSKIPGATNATCTLTNLKTSDSGNYSVTITNLVGTVSSANSYVSVIAPPTITLARSNITLLPQLTATLVATVKGAGVLTYQWSHDGTLIPGATTNTYTITCATNSDVGTYTISVSNFGGTTQADVVATMVPDTNAPLLTLNTVSATYTNSSFMLSGKAQDNVGVSGVSYSLNGAAFTNGVTTNAWTNWSANVVFDTRGTNILVVKAVDVNGNVAALITNKPAYAPFYRAALTVAGIGKIQTNWSGNIQYGKLYSATAQPGAGYVFTKWTGDLTTNSPKNSFVASGDISLIANFTTNLFLNSGGAYNGLFINSSPAHTNSGFFSATVTTNLLCTAKLLLDGDSLSYSGNFDPNGSFVTTLTRTNKSPVALNLSMDFTNNAIIGTIAADGWVSTLQADLAFFSAKKTTTNAGSFTFVLPQSDLGYSFGLIQVSTNGIVTLTGMAADGTALSQTVPLSEDGYWPCFVPLYFNGKTNQGEFWGWVNFSNNLPVGTLSWCRPAGMAPYLSGFSNVALIESSAFVGPKNAPKGLFTTFGLISFTGGNITAPFSEYLMIDDSGIVHTEGASSLKVLNGQISGTVIDPVSGLSAKLAGMILQNTNRAEGTILSTNGLGEFVITPYP